MAEGRFTKLEGAKTTSGLTPPPGSIARDAPKKNPVVEDEANYPTFVLRADEAFYTGNFRDALRHYSRAAFIDTGMGETEHVADIARRKAEQEGWVFERLQGNRRMLDALINGAWDPEEYLVVPPEHRIEQALSDGLMRAVKP